MVSVHTLVISLDINGYSKSFCRLTFHIYNSNIRRIPSKTMKFNLIELLFREVQEVLKSKHTNTKNEPKNQVS